MDLPFCHLCNTHGYFNTDSENEASFTFCETCILKVTSLLNVIERRKQPNAPIITSDTSHAYTQGLLDAIDWIRRQRPELSDLPKELESAFHIKRT